jgi:hypothetical protein
MIAEAAKLDAMQYSVQYELLRSQVIGTVESVTPRSVTGQTCGIGFALLLNEGMPGWLKTVESVLRGSLAPRIVDSPDPALPEITPRPSAAPVWLPAVLRDEVTMLLASLVLSTRTLARQSSKGGVIGPC